jgi:hypothetical protein
MRTAGRNGLGHIVCARAVGRHATVARRPPVTPGQEIMAYEAPKLTRYGTFRELTQQGSKRVIGDDLVPGIGMDCDGSAPQGDPAACIRS